MFINNKASTFAAKCHALQVRKYPNTMGVFEPFIFHPARVVAAVLHFRDKFPENKFDDYVNAAWCHDVIEDCGVTVSQLAEEVSPRCASYVDALTNESTKFGQPFKSRKVRKQIDRMALSNASKYIQMIKMLDRIDNITSLVFCPDLRFIRKYLDESFQLYEVICRADSDIATSLITHITNGYNFLKDKEHNVAV